MAKETEEERKARLEIKRREAGLGKPKDDTGADIESLRAEMLTEIEESKGELFVKFKKDVDLRDVFVGVFTHEVSKYCDLKLEDEVTGSFVGRHMQAYIKLKELRRLGLIRFLRVIEISEKRMRKEKLDQEEKQALAKWKDWDKTLTKKGHDCFYPKINYYATTEKGKDPKFLRFIANVRKEKQDF